MLEPVARVFLILLVILVAALGARAFFADSNSADESSLPAPLPPPPLPQAPRATPEPAEHKPITIVDPDPDLEHNLETTDCPGLPESPAEPTPKEKEPAPH